MIERLQKPSVINIGSTDLASTTSPVRMSVPLSSVHSRAASDLKSSYRPTNASTSNKPWKRSSLGSVSKKSGSFVAGGGSRVAVERQNVVYSVMGNKLEIPRGSSTSKSRQKNMSNDLLNVQTTQHKDDIDEYTMRSTTPIKTGSQHLPIAE